MNNEKYQAAQRAHEEAIAQSARPDTDLSWLPNGGAGIDRRMKVADAKASHFIRAQAKLPKLEDFDGAGMLARSMAAGNVMWRALGVLTRDRKVREWLTDNDPQALGEALAAMALWTEEHPALNVNE